MKGCRSCKNLAAPLCSKSNTEDFQIRDVAFVKTILGLRIKEWPVQMVVISLYVRWTAPHIYWFAIAERQFVGYSIIVDRKFAQLPELWHFALREPFIWPEKVHIAPVGNSSERSLTSSTLHPSTIVEQKCANETVVGAFKQTAAYPIYGARRSHAWRYSRLDLERTNPANSFRRRCLNHSCPSNGYAVSGI